MAPRISVLIPAHQAQDWIERAIASAWNQTVPPDEVIVGDDGSLDATASKAEAAGATVLRLPKANGAVARNRAAELARGDVLFFLDADDWWAPEKIERHLEVWSREDPSFVVDVAQKVRPDGAHAGLLGEGAEGPVPWEAYLSWQTWTSGSSFSVPKARYEALGGFNESLVSQQDVDFWVRCAHRFGPAHRLADPQTFYRLSPGGVSKKPRDVEANLHRLFEGWPFASETQKTDFRRLMLLTAAGFSRFPEALRYYRLAGWPMGSLKFWRSMARSLVRTARQAPVRESGRK